MTVGLANKDGRSLLAKLEDAEQRVVVAEHHADVLKDILEYERDFYKKLAARWGEEKRVALKSRDNYRAIADNALAMAFKDVDPKTHGRHCGCVDCRWPETSTAHPFGD